MQNKDRRPEDRERGDRDPRRTHSYRDKDRERERVPLDKDDEYRDDVGFHLFAFVVLVDEPLITEGL